MTLKLELMTLLLLLWLQHHSINILGLDVDNTGTMTILNV